jgi:ABC-type arginine/histidine transport system permease subunit
MYYDKILTISLSCLRVYVFPVTIMQLLSHSTLKWISQCFCFVFRVSPGTTSMYSALFGFFIYNISTTAEVSLAVHISKKKELSCPAMYSKGKKSDYNKYNSNT